jgi:hypothetical protein
MTLKESIEKRYIVQTDGNVFSKKTKRNLKFFQDKKGYLKSRIYCPEVSQNPDGRKPVRQHRLVAMFYLEDFCDDKQINHKNGIKTDNRIENLEMVTNSENVLHAWNVLDSTERKNKLNQRRQSNGKFGK